MTREYQKGLAEALALAPVVPVMVIEKVEDAVPLARALVKGGLPVLEITLRTAKAMDCIRAIIAEVEGAIVGSGTVLTPEQLKESEKLGCKFAVSPGSTGRLLGAAEDHDIALLPGGDFREDVVLYAPRANLKRRYADGSTADAYRNQLVRDLQGAVMTEDQFGMITSVSLSRARCASSPARISSYRTRPGKIGSPAASAEVQLSGRSACEFKLKIAPESPRQLAVCGKAR